jgi:hypothetical protein
VQVAFGIGEKLLGLALIFFTKKLVAWVLGGFRLWLDRIRDPQLQEMMMDAYRQIDADARNQLGKDEPLP